MGVGAGQLLKNKLPNPPSSCAVDLKRGESMAKLTKKSVDEARPHSKSYLLWDGELRGFGLLVLPSGVKSYVLQYRNEARRSRRLTIGRHGALNVGQACELAQEAAGAIAKGVDTGASKPSYLEPPTLFQLLARYFTLTVIPHTEVSQEKDIKLSSTKQLQPIVGT